MYSLPNERMETVPITSSYGQIARKSTLFPPQLSQLDPTSMLVTTSRTGAISPVSFTSDMFTIYQLVSALFQV